MNEASSVSKRGPARSLGILLALALPLALAWWLQRDEDSTRPGTSGPAVVDWRQEIEDEIARLPSPSQPLSFAWPGGPSRYRLSVRVRDASPQAAAITGIPDDAFERGIAQRNRDLWLSFRPDETSDQLRIIIETIDEPRDPASPRAIFLLDRKSGALTLSQGAAIRPELDGRSPRRWLLEELCVFWPSIPREDQRSFSPRPLPDDFESFKAGRVRKDLQVFVRAHDRNAGGAWLDAEGSYCVAAYLSAVLDGEHWQGRQETKLRAQLLHGDALPPLTGSWESEERFLLRRDAPTTAEATHRIVVEQRVAIADTEETPAPGR